MGQHQWRTAPKIDPSMIELHQRILKPFMNLFRPIDRRVLTADSLIRLFEIDPKASKESNRPIGHTILDGGPMDDFSDLE